MNDHDAHVADWQRWMHDQSAHVLDWLSHLDRIAFVYQTSSRLVCDLSYFKIEDQEQYARALKSVASFLRSIESTFIAEGSPGQVAERLELLACAISDLKDGITHPILEAAKYSGRPLDRSDIWAARGMAAAGLEFLNKSGETLEVAANTAAKTFPQLARLVRPGRTVTLQSSIVGWRDAIERSIREKKEHPAGALYKETVEQAEAILPVLVNGHPTSIDYRKRGLAFLRDAEVQACRLTIEPTD
jgi:hypothetical protein